MVTKIIKLVSNIISILKFWIMKMELFNFKKFSNHMGHANEWIGWIPGLIFEIAWAAPICVGVSVSISPYVFIVVR